MRDNMGLVQQLGLDPDAVALKQAEADQKKGFSLPDFHAKLRGAKPARISSFGERRGPKKCVFLDQFCGRQLFK